MNNDQNPQPTDEKKSSTDNCQNGKDNTGEKLTTSTSESFLKTNLSPVVTNETNFLRY
jgi:hypothetical protein